MSEIIVQDLLKCNNITSFLTNESQHSIESTDIIRIPKTQYNILAILLEYFDSCREFIYGNRFIGKRLGLSEGTISTHLADLKRIGFVEHIDSGRNFDVLRLTDKAITWLFDQPLTQSLTQTTYIPYIDLSKNKEEEILKILNEEENQIRYEEPFEKVAETFLQSPQISFREKEAVKNDLRASKIGPVRLERVLRGIVAVMKKGPIHRIRAYLRTCLLNEEKKIRELKNLFNRFKMKPTIMYSTQECFS